MQSLTPPQLAGVLTAIVTSERVSKPQLWVAYEPSAAVINAVRSLEVDREELYKAQVQHSVQVSLAVDLRLAGRLLVAATCATWSAACGMHLPCSMSW